MSRTFLRIGAISYEGSVFGWDVKTSASSSSKKSEEDESHVEGLISKMVFGFHVSQGSMKSIAVSDSGKYMLCGGMDERIRIFDVSKNVAIGELSGHTGCVTSLQFVGDKFVVSGSEDSNLCIWRVQDWMCVHILGGHKDTINDLAVHPTGKLALSVSKDNTMKLWNLVQGRCSFTRRLQGPADKVDWNVGGDMYLLIVGSELQIYSASDNSCIASIKMRSRINQARFVDTGSSTEENMHYVAVICEDKTLSIVDLKSEVRLSRTLKDIFEEGRPRDMFCCKPCTDLKSKEMSIALEGEGDSITIVTSTGRLAVFSARALLDLSQGTEDGDESNLELAMLSHATVSAEPRLTGVVAWLPFKSKSQKKKEKTEMITEQEIEEASATSTPKDKAGSKKTDLRKQKEKDPDSNKKVRFN